MPSLGNDLAAIRKKLDLTIEDIHEATKIPIHILESIEDDTIFDDLDQNATYIRSYVRSYAKKLEIEEERTIRALDQVERGSYSGILRDESKTGTIPKFQGKPKEPYKPKEQDEKPKSKKKESPEPKEKSEAKPVTPPDTPKSQTTETPSVHSVDWVDMGRKFKPLKSRSRLWVGVVIVIIAVIGIFGIYYLFRGDTTPADTSEQQSPVTTTEAVQPDSLQLSLTGPDNADTVRQTQTQPAESLSDTLSLAIYAAYQKLEPVRVYTDVMASLNPYWIELGEAVRFKFVNTIRIRGPYERMVLLLNGHVIENFEERFLNPESGMVEINREAFEGESKWLQPPPDSLGLNVPDPTVIKNQPIFN